MEIDLKTALANEQPASAGCMKQANVMLGLHKDASTVKRFVTPCEVQLLVMMHLPNNGRCPILGITFEDEHWNTEIRGQLDRTHIPEVKRTYAQEVQRLRAIYGRERVAKLFGPNSTPPATFNEAIESAMMWAADGNVMEDRPLTGRKPTSEELAAAVER